MPYPSNDPPVDLNDDSVEANYRVTGSELKSFVERVEYVEAQMVELRDDRKEIYAEAKSRGFDTAVIRQIVKRRKEDPETVAEREAVFDMYWEAILEA